MKFDKKVIEARAKRLEEARVYLKSELIGIDDIIDKFINNVKVWYILPEIQTRPLIVNLWGITGAGKTDLVRKFVNFLDFSDKFCEVQLDSKEGNADIEEYLENTFDTNDVQGVLLLDEMQRFRTIKDDGAEHNSNKFQDVWMLLSDGVLQSNSKIRQELIQMIVEDEYWSERIEHDEKVKKLELDTKEKTEEAPSNQAVKTNFKYRMYYYEANKMKRLLKLTEDVDTIMRYTKEQKLAIVKEKLSNKETFQGKHYSKLLIVICGNLDEAFNMAKNVSDVDNDADVYHEFSKTIDIIQIKKALRFRFKPEQIARFGNTHLIYPILNKASYRAIIKQKINRIISYIKEQHKITLVVDDSVYDVIYRNGVFPVQGVRPLMSTISSVFENSLPFFLFEQLNSGSKRPVKIFHEDGFLYATIKGQRVSYEVPRVLEEVKQKQTKNQTALISVHEAGHAVAYAVLFKTSPVQITANTAEQGGFIGVHNTLGSYTDIINDAIVTFAGRAAEELVFGKDIITSGAASDYNHNSVTISEMVRKLGMDDFKAVYIPEFKNESHLKSSSTIELRVEDILSELYDRALELLENHKPFLLALSKELNLKLKLDPIEFKKFAHKYIGEINIVNPKDKLEPEFNNKLEEALTNVLV